MLEVKETENGRMISARELHAYLGIHRNFSNWLKERIHKYQFEENCDYRELWVHAQTGEISKKLESAEIMSENGYVKDYYISYNMAEALCIIENTTQSRKVRKYLMMCEEKYMNFINAKLYLLDEGRIDNEKLRAWQELLDLSKEFEPLLKGFTSSMLNLIDHACKVSVEMNDMQNGLNGIEEF